MNDENEVIVHLSKTPEDCDHIWVPEGNPERCEKCGLSFIRYAFTMCE